MPPLLLPHECNALRDIVQLLLADDSSTARLAAIEDAATEFLDNMLQEFREDRRIRGLHKVWSLFLKHQLAGRNTLREALNMASVDCHTRQLVLNSPQAWSNVDRMSSVGIQNLSAVLARSAPISMRVDLAFAAYAQLETILMISQHIGRFRYLKLRFSALQKRSIWDGIHHALSSSAAPHLEEFSLQFDGPTPFLLPERLFQGVSPVLRKLCLSLLALPPRCPSLGLVTTFVTLDSAVPTVFVEKIIAICPQMKHLRVNGILLLPIPAAYTPRTVPRLGALLRSLHLSEATPDLQMVTPLEPYLPTLQHASVSTMILMRVSIPAVRLAVEALGLLTLLGFAWTPNGAHLLLHDVTRSRLFTPMIGDRVDTSISRLLLGTKFRTITQLTIGDQLPLQDVEYLQMCSADFPVLGSITIVMLGQHRPEVGTVHLVDVAQQQLTAHKNRWRLPRLRTLTVTVDLFFSPDSELGWMTIRRSSLSTLIDWFSVNKLPEMVTIHSHVVVQDDGGAEAISSILQCADFVSEASSSVFRFPKSIKLEQL